MSSPPSQDPNAEAHHFSESVPEGDAGLTMPPIHTSPPAQPTRPPTLRPLSDPEAIVTVSASSTPLGLLKAARRPGPAQPGLSSVRGGSLPQDMQAKMRAFHQSRQGAPPGPGTKGLGGLGSTSPTGGKIPVTMMGRGASGGCVATPGGLGGPLAGSPGAFRLPPNTRPQAHNAISAPVVPNAQTGPKLGGLAAKRMGGGLKLSDAMGPTPPALADGALGSLAVPNGIHDIDKPAVTDNIFNKYSDIVDTKTGTLRFKGKATIDGEGIDFSSGRSFKISLDEVDTIEELGKGNYGTVYQVRHSRPRMRRPGLGLQGNKAPPQFSVSAMTTHTTSSQLSESPDAVTASDPASSLPPARGNTTGLVMAMKEIRLELDEAKFAAIIMELDILHRCTSPFIVDFYGAFFQEGAVYICMEFMDGGSIDKLYGDGIPENVLRKITLATVMGLKSLKDEHNIIHRDVKPTNILANSRGQIKICDFGVSGNLVASIAKTNIGCQSYMAPERIASGGIAQAGANQGGGTYSVQSDIWSLGLSVIECAMGRYPYPPETYNNIFSQLSAIVDGDPPNLPETGYSDTARDFVRSCLNKTPRLRPTYAMLTRHQWLAPLLKPPTIAEDDEEIEADSPLSPAVAALSLSSESLAVDREVGAWVRDAMERRRSGTMGKSTKPALHAVSLDVVGSPAQETEPDVAVAAGGDLGPSSSSSERGG